MDTEFQVFSSSPGCSRMALHPVRNATMSSLAATPRSRLPMVVCSSSRLLRNDMPCGSVRLRKTRGPGLPSSRICPRALLQVSQGGPANQPRMIPSFIARAIRANVCGRAISPSSRWKIMSIEMAIAWAFSMQLWKSSCLRCPENKCAKTPVYSEVVCGLGRQKLHMILHISERNSSPQSSGDSQRLVGPSANDN